MTKVLLLILGGAIGTGLRFGISTWVQKVMFLSFPLGHTFRQCIGIFPNWLLLDLAETFNFSIHTRAFLFTGFFGGFTTFSSFTLDSMVLIKTGEYKIALLNIVISNVLGLIAVFLGILLGKNVIALR